jgi:excisionase family DNA binding protein
MTTEQWLTIREASAQYNFTAEYLRQLLREGKINGRKRGWHWEIDRESLEQHKRMTGSNHGAQTS